MSEVPRGRFVWYELLAHDPRVARDFYSEVLGWGVEVYEGLATPYPMFTVSGTPMGGVLQISAEAIAAGTPSLWLGYVTTPNVDDTVARAMALGATRLVEPHDIGTIGRMAVLADPQGAQMAFYTPSRPPEADPEPRLGEVSWRELATTDPAAAAGFYAELFGWRTVNQQELGALGTYRVFGDGVRPRGGMFDRPHGMATGWLYYVRVEHLEGTLRRVEERGGVVLDGPRELPGGDRVARCRDPQGATFALHRRA